MFFSEWGVMVNNEDALNYAINLITLHNSSYTEPLKRLVAYSVFDFEGNLYMIIGNGGNPTLSSAFLLANNDGLQIFYPAKKPVWWGREAEREYLWNPDRSLPDCPDFPTADIFNL